MAALVEGGGAVPPLLTAALLPLSLVQQLAALCRPTQLFIVSHGARSLDSASSCAWGIARVLRLEHMALRAQSAHAAHGVVVNFALPSATMETELVWYHAKRLAARLHVGNAAPQAELARGSYVIAGTLKGFGLRVASLL